MARDGGGSASGAQGENRTAPGTNRRRQEAGFSIFLDQVADADGRSIWETRLYHAESGSETTFAGASPDDWIGWMLEQLGAVEVTPGDAPHGRARPSIEVASVEIIDLSSTEQDADQLESTHTIRAEVVVQINGVARIEREIGSRVLQTLARSSGRRRSTEDHAQRP